MLGGFRLIREIACGGMATVYLAHKTQQAGIQQLAAVKVIHPHLARDKDFVDMFLDEARIVSCINHPNVCRVLDFGKSEGTYYLAMEYFLGETWAEVTARMTNAPEAESMIVPVLAQVLGQACEGLHAAHEAQDGYGNPLRIVHRDVSPHNIMVGYDGSVRVLDFGIASATDRLHTTRSGAVKGRLAYMAPEQVRGTPVDRRADVWSLGVVLWEALARKLLFQGSNEAETVMAVTRDPLPSLSDLEHGVPAPLQRIVTQALQRNRESRYASARELGVALSRFATKAQEPVGMPEVSEWMHRLFAQELEGKRALTREALGSSRAPSMGMASVPDEPRNSPSERTARCTSVSGIRPVARHASLRMGKRLGVVAILLAVAWLGLAGRERSGPDARPQPAPVAASREKRPDPPSAARGNVSEQEPSVKGVDLAFDLAEIEEHEARPASSK